MSWSYIGTSRGDGTGTSAVAVPGTVQDDDLLVAVAIARNDGLPMSCTGWTRHGYSSSTLGADLTTSLLSKIASSESGSWSFDGGGGNHTIAIVGVFRGVDTASPFVGIATWGQNYGNSTVGAMSMATTNDNDLLVTVVGNAGDSTYNYNAPSGTTIVDAIWTGNYDFAGMAYVVVPTGGTTPSLGLWTIYGSSTAMDHVGAATFKQGAGAGPVARRSHRVFLLG